MHMIYHSQDEFRAETFREALFQDALCVIQQSKAEILYKKVQHKITKFEINFISFMFKILT